MVRTLLSLLSCNTSGSQATTACGRSGTSSGKSATDTVSNLTLLAVLLEQRRCDYAVSLVLSSVLNSTD